MQQWRLVSAFSRRNLAMGRVMGPVMDRAMGRMVCFLFQATRDGCMLPLAPASQREI